MSGEVTIPLLPCLSIDEVEDFYRALGFETTYRQVKPNPYVALRREDLHLHFFGMNNLDPAQSYSTCLVQVPDTGALYDAFAAGMRTRYGKLLTAGIPRMTRPRRKQGNTMGFMIVDPGGNWIRIVRAGTADAGEDDGADRTTDAADDGRADRSTDAADDDGADRSADPENASSGAHAGRGPWTVPNPI